TDMGSEESTIWQKPALLLWGGGGRGEVVDNGPDYVDGTMEDHTIAPSHIVPVRRTDDTKQLAFCHALPRTCLDKVTHDYQPGAILDIAVGDESLALTAVEPNHVHGLRIHGQTQGHGHGPIA
ncbi:MAG: hypothetical protein ACKPKO_07190, partial [Candidatus Fonsibacter sp.]